MNSPKPHFGPPTTYINSSFLPIRKKKKLYGQIFEDKNADIKTRQSSNGKYTSVSISVKMANPDEVIEYYKKAGKVEGIFSL